MGQLSKGITLGYATYSETREPAPTYTKIAGITGIPALGSSPATQDATTLDDAMHVYVKGLIDVGGALDFPCIFTPEIITAVQTAVTAQESATQEFAVEFPAPLSERAYFTGEISPVFNESADVDAVLTGTVSIVPTSDIVWEAVV